jgi:hypothetical protein
MKIEDRTPYGVRSPRELPGEPRAVRYRDVIEH